MTQGIPGSYDLITMFDVVHDMPRPRPALKEVRQALKPDGTYFVLEFNFFGLVLFLVVVLAVVRFRFAGWRSCHSLAGRLLIQPSRAITLAAMTPGSLNLPRPS